MGQKCWQITPVWTNLLWGWVSTIGKFWSNCGQERSSGSVYAFPDSCGHFAAKKKLRSFCQSFWWPHIRPDVERNLAWCLPCAGRSIAWRKRIEKLVPFKDRIQFQTIAIDILGPVTITNASRVKHIIAMIDIFTKYIVGFPLRSTESLDVANEIVGIWVLLFDVPDALYRYQSRNIGRKLGKLLKIDKRRTSTYHSQGNGQKEIHNSVIADVISKSLSRNPRIWDRMLIYMGFIYNTTIHCTMQIT